MITIEEAIERLKVLRQWDLKPSELKAIQLGIEALERMKWQRQTKACWTGELPSEKDSQRE